MKNFGDAVILCGGESRRMPFDKSLIKLNGKYLIEQLNEKLTVCFENIKLCADSKDRFRAFSDTELYADSGDGVLAFVDAKICEGTGDRFRAFGMEVIEDKIKGRFGPAVGIYSALSQTATKYVFLVACDMPLVSVEHIKYMKYALERESFAHDALIPMNGGFIEPLYGFYSTGITGVFEEEITKGRYKIHDILDKCNVLYLDEKYSRMFDESLAMFTNINSAADLEMFIV